MALELVNDRPFAIVLDAWLETRDRSEPGPQLPAELPVPGEDDSPRLVHRNHDGVPARGLMRGLVDPAHDLPDPVGPLEPPEPLSLELHRLRRA